jgi:hypothetical protein
VSYPISKCRYPDDVARIISIAASRGVSLTALEAEKAWEEYSDSMAAGWMMLGDDEEVWACLPSWAVGVEAQENP